MADPTEYYVDHDNGNDSTGDGSSGTPWKTVEYALDTGITPDTTDGDRIWVTGTGGETLTQTWGNTVFAAGYGDGEPLQIIGYGSTPGDGIAAPIIKSTSTYYLFPRQNSVWFNFVNLNFQHNGTAGWLVDTNRGKFDNCHFSRTVDTTGGYISAGLSQSAVVVKDCSFVDCGTAGGVQVFHASVTNSVFKEQGTYAQKVGAADSLIEGNSAAGMLYVDSCIVITAGGYGCRVRGTSFVRNNSFYCADNTQGARGAIVTSNDAGNAVIENNIISSYNGTNHAGLYFGTTARGIISRNNTFYDVTAVDVNSPSYIIDDGNETVGTDPFTDAANGDFTPIDTGSIKEGSYPGQFPDI